MGDYNVLLDVAMSFIYGVLYGFSLAVPPGPMNALIAHRSIRSYRLGFMTGLGALSADLLFMVTTIYGFGFLRSINTRIFYFIGSAYMFFLAYSVLRPTNKQELRNGYVNNMSVVSSYIAALLLGLTNPYQIMWWISVGVSFLSLLGIFSIAGIFVAIMLWIALFPYLVRTGYTLNSNRTDSVIRTFSSATLLFFASYLLLNYLTV